MTGDMNVADRAIALAAVLVAAPLIVLSYLVLMVRGKRPMHSAVLFRGEEGMVKGLEFSFRNEGVGGFLRRYSVHQMASFFWVVSGRLSFRDVMLLPEGAR